VSGEPDVGTTRRLSALRGLLAPSRLAPVELDLRRVLLAGIGLWLVAGAVCGVLAATGAVDVTAALICATGAALGVVGLGWDRRRRARAERRAG
jgi:hypothetical protein